MADDLALAQGFLHPVQALRQMLSIVHELELHRILFYLSGFALLRCIELFADFLPEVFHLKRVDLRCGSSRQWTQAVCWSHVSLTFWCKSLLALLNLASANFWVIIYVETGLRKLLILIVSDATKSIKLVRVGSHRHPGSSIVYFLEVLSQIQAVTIACFKTISVFLLLHVFRLSNVQARLHTWQLLFIELS